MIRRNMQFVAIGFLLSLVMIGSVAQAQRSRPYRATDYQVRTLIDRLASKTTSFRSRMELWINSSQSAGTRAEDNANLFTDDLESSINQLRDDFARNQSSKADAQEVLDRAARLDTFLTRRTPDAATARIWASLRTDVNTLGRYYEVTWRPYNGQNQNRPGDNNLPPNGGNYPPREGNYPQRGGEFANRLTGTYELDSANSDDPQAAADRALRGIPYNERQQVSDSLMRRLDAPEKIAIERQGRSVTLASSRSGSITITADGRQQTETTSSGRTIRASATFNGDQLMVSTAGDRNNDFNVTFDPMDNGRRLRVIRRVSTDRLAAPVTVLSVYNRISDVAQFDIYTGDRRGESADISNGEFVVPDNTPIVAVLDTDLRTETTQNNDRFRMTVRSPGEYEGAVIEGYVSGVTRSGKITGRSGMTMNFDTIRLRNGRTYKFAGLVENVRTPNGESVRVDNEGTVEDKTSRGTTTATRAGIGTAVGALIGAIAGGGKGAAIGAIVGAGAGAGSVYVQGRDDLALVRGTEVNVRATAPRDR